MRYLRHLKNILITCYLRIKGFKVGENVTFISAPTFRCYDSKLVTIADGVVFDKNVTIWQVKNGKIDIGEKCYIGIGTIINSSIDGSISIGKNTLIGAYVLVQDNDHGISRDDLIINQGNQSSPINIGEDCWIGAHSIVLRGSTLGNHSVIGASALVKGNVNEWAVAVGIPATEIKKR